MTAFLALVKEQDESVRKAMTTWRKEHGFEWEKLTAAALDQARGHLADLLIEAAENDGEPDPTGLVGARDDTDAPERSEDADPTPASNGSAVAASPTIAEGGEGSPNGGIASSLPDAKPACRFCGSTRADLVEDDEGLRCVVGNACKDRAEKNAEATASA